MNIKKYVRDILMDKTIVDLTADKKVYFLHANNPKSPYVEYEFYNENGADYSENKETSTNYYIQIDIFSNEDYTELETKIKEKMISEGFTRGMAADMYEKDTRLYHKAMRFNISLPGD